MEYVNRTIEETLNKYIGLYPIIMITGPRQVGKTTLLNYISTKYKEINYVTLDDMILRAQANDDPELFLRTHETPLIIDEFQYAPNLLNYIKINVDEKKKDAMFGSKNDIGTLYYLTGSQIFQTMKNVSESLAGRVGIFDLSTFTNRELEHQKDELFIPDIKLLKNKTPLKRTSIMNLFERILNGSYPEIHFGSKINRDHYYSDYIRTYIERDVKRIINIKNENKFVKFISAIAARTGQEFNSNAIGSDIEIDNKTVDEWISILKNTGIIYLVQPYLNNSVGRAVKRPKIYFMDTGLACYLAGYTSKEALEKSSYSGPIFETFIVSEIIKTFINQGYDPRKYIYYYRDNNQKEIDLLIIMDNKVYPIEIKKSSNPKETSIKNFDIVKNFGVEVGNGTVLCLIKNITAIDSDNYFVPIEYL